MVLGKYTLTGTSKAEPLKIAKRLSPKAIFLCLLAFLSINTPGFALDKKTSLALSHYIMAGMHEQLGDVDQAIEEYKQALKSDFQSAVIHCNLASSYIRKNALNQAIEELKLAASFSPDATEPHAILALVYSSQNQPGLATQEYEAALNNALKTQPKNIDIYKALGELYLQKKNFAAAEKTYKLILGLSPQDEQAHFYLANIYDELNDEQKAEEELKKLLQLKPDYPQALNYLGYMYVEANKNLDAAENMIKKALEIDPDNGAYTDSLGWLYFKKNKIKEAIKELEKASSLLEDPVIFEHLGDVYLKAGDMEKAKTNWEKSLKLNPDQEKIKEKIEKLNKPR